MSRQRMRYQWFRDMPRNVTRREYQRLGLLNLGSAFLGAMSAVMAFSAVTGLTLKTSQDLEKVPGLSVQEAVDYQGDRLEWVKVEGMLVTDEILTMPDDESNQPIIQGKLTITASDEAGAEDDEGRRVTLLEWEAAAQSVFLAEGDRRLPLAFDLTRLPVPESPSPDVSPRPIQAGDSARIRRPVAIEYGDEVFSLPGEEWESVFTNVERQVLPQGQTVVIVAMLEPTPQGNQLVAATGQRLQVHLGSEQDIREQGQQVRLLFGILCIPFGIASFLVWRSASRLRQEFVERSNE